MTGNRDRYGEPLEDDDTLAPASGPTRKARIAELRKILRDARERRPSDER